MDMWRVPKIWANGECYILGGGASVLSEFNVPTHIVRQVRRDRKNLRLLSPYLHFLHDKHVIGVNAASFIGDWIDICFFGDFGFFERYRHLLAEMRCMKVSCDKRFRKDDFEVDKIKYLQHDSKKPAGISTKPGFVSWNKNSGAAAISLAAQLGVKKIYLLGFDMSVTNNQQHFHNVYRPEHNGVAEKTPFTRHLKGFPEIARDARKLGIEIINVNPDSKINNFEKKHLKDLL